MTSCPLPPDGVPLLPQIVGPIQVARRSDMDMNGHVNNVTYLAWALETVPSNIYSDCHLYQARGGRWARLPARPRPPPQALLLVLRDAAAAAAAAAAARLLLAGAAPVA